MYTFEGSYTPCRIAGEVELIEGDQYCCLKLYTVTMDSWRRQHCDLNQLLQLLFCHKLHPIIPGDFLRGRLQLSDISENPNNDRIGGDPPTPPPPHPLPPNPNKYLMLDVFLVLHILGVHRLLPTTNTVQGVSSSFPTENSDERLDCACTVVTITGLSLSLPWLDAGAREQGCSGAGIIPGSQCPVGLSKFQEVRPASSSFQLPRASATA